MRRFLLFYILSILFFLTGLANAAEIKPRSNITSVVVYPDRALVTRTADLSLDRGEHVLVFESLPTNIDIDSLRAKGEGEARVRIFSTESKKIVLEVPRQEEIARLEAEIQDVRDQIAAADARINNLRAEYELVRSIGVYTGQQFSKEFITRQPKPDEWNAMLEFQRNNMSRISEEILQSEIRIRELNRRLDALLRELGELQGQSARESEEVRVVISALTPGEFRLSLLYVVYGAGWYPGYDARADFSAEKVGFTYIGNVRQNTGEDWSGVEVSLSTARPAVGAKMPELPPWYLRPQPPIRYERYDLEEKALGREPLEMAPAAPAEAVTAQLVRLGTSVQFKVPLRMDIPSDNAYHRATILTEDLPAKFSYSATPKLSPFAYLVAKLKNTTGAQWLAGKVNAFVDGDFVGTYGIDPVAPNEEITLDFGVDENITVKREALVRKEDETHLFGKKKEIRFKDRITIENHRAKSVDLLLIDQIPVSQNDDIKVSDVRFSEKPAELDQDTGIVKWDLLLVSGQKKEITIEFIVTHPLDMNVMGL